MYSQPVSQSASVSQQKANGISGKFGHLLKAERPRLPPPQPGSEPGHGLQLPDEHPWMPPYGDPGRDDFIAAEIEVTSSKQGVGATSAMVNDAKTKLSSSKSIISRMNGTYASAQKGVAKAEKHHLEQQERARLAEDELARFKK